MEDFEQVLDSFIDELKGPQAPIVRPDPQYDAVQRADSVEWQWRPPAQSPVAGRLDLSYVARSLGSLQPQQLQELKQLSQTLNAQRTQLLHCPLPQLYQYAHAMHQLSLRLTRGDFSYPSHFVESRSHSPEFVYEYAQTLLLLGARLHDQALAARDEKLKAECYGQLVALFDQLHACASIVTGEQYEASRRLRWQFEPPPLTSTLSSNGTAHVLRAPNELQRLRNWVTSDLGGPQQLQAHALLFQAKTNESRARFLQVRGKEDDEAKHNERLYKVVAPLLQAVIEDYEAIGQLLGPDTQLARYAERARLYWFTQQQVWLARSDAARFKQGEGFDAYGKRALRRLEAMGDCFDASEHTQVTLLYEELYTALSTGYTSGGSSLPLEAVQRGVVSKRADFTSLCQAHWTQCQWAAVVESGLQALQQLRRHSESDLGEIGHTPTTMASSGVAPHSMSNEAKRELLLDRQDVLTRLLGRIDSQGQIVLDAHDCESLRRELQTVQLRLAANERVGAPRL